MNGARRAVGIVVVGLALLAGATLLDGWLPDEASDAVADPFVRSAVVGDELDLRTVSLKVDAVTGAHSVVEFGAEVTSPGVWVVVQYTVVAKRENTAITFAELRDDDGRVWGTDGRSENTCLQVAPGIRNGCVAVFEVPPDALPSLRLRLSPTEEQRFDEVADVDLGLTTEDADRFIQVTGSEVPSTKLGDS